VRNAVAGVLAGAAGTAAMDLLLYVRYRQANGKESFRHWELADDVTTWDEASAPGQLARRAWRRFTGDEPPDVWARPATNIVHWATGVGWGAAYGVLASATSRRPWSRALALGPVAWLSGYVVLPLAKVYEPIWKYDKRALVEDLTAHLVYGDVASAVFWALTAKGDSR
jgi:hypothetical protein